MGHPRIATAVTALTAAMLLTTAITTGATASAMSGGTDAPDPHETPWAATFAVKGAGPLLGRASCGGALVEPDLVLTAAHCVDGVDPAGVEVHLGASVLSRDPGVVRGVQGIRIAAGYALLPSPVAPDSPELSSAKDDLAAVRLDRPVPAVTPLRAVTTTPAPGTPITFYGHGITAPDRGVADVLRRGLLTVRSDADCVATTPAVVDGPSVLCTGAAPGQPAQGCLGDSGGPAVVRDEAGELRLAGIFSYGMETAGLPCGAPGINAFADVTAGSPAASPPP